MQAIILWTNIHKIKDKLEASTEGNNTLIQKVNKQTKMRSGNKNMITKNYITTIIIMIITSFYLLHTVLQGRRSRARVLMR
jgi:Na+/citrate or Na+/malate symporter